MKKLPRIRILALVAICIAALAVSGCGGQKVDTKALAKSRLQGLGLLVLMTATAPGNKEELFPNLSTPETAASDLTVARKKRIEETGDANFFDEKIFIHPATEKPFIPNANLTGVSMAKVGDANPTNVILFYAPEPDGDQRAVLYADGHVEWVDEVQWPTKKAAGWAR